MEFYAYSSEDDDSASPFVIHNAAEVGDVEVLRSLLEKKPVELEQPLVEGQVPVPLPIDHTRQPDYDLDLRDEDECTPLHIAILNGHLEVMETLLNLGASATKKIEGSPPLHLTVCAGSHSHLTHTFTAPALRLLLQNGAVAYDRDDQGRTALHWAAFFNLTSAAEVLLDSAKEFAMSQSLATAAAVEGVDEDQAPPAALPALLELQDRFGNTALHLAARYGSSEAVKLLLNECLTGNGPSHIDLIKLKNKAGMNCIHMAAFGGNINCAKQLVQAAPTLLTETTKQGLDPAALAAKRGHSPALVQLLTTGDVNSLDLSGPSSPRLDKNAVAGKRPPPHSHSYPLGKAGYHHVFRTLLVAPPECLNHHTAPWPIVRGAPAPPPENVNRLMVLTKPKYGILKTNAFENRLVWDEKPRKAALGDILRVHDWAYVRKIQSVCEKIPEATSAISNLDGDTAISNGTYAGALAAAGAVCHAVDEVVVGKVRNAFCAVRPPGHHAGPGGVVTCRNDPHGSHGFCLFNNVAIGAAYAMTVHRHAGVKKVAILDFDVHHGNGTEACVANTAPSLEKYAFTTPYGEGMQQFPVYKPWHDVDDKDNVFFASVQGYGPKSMGMNAYVYPGSGATCDTRTETPAADLAEVELKPGEESAVEHAASDVEEDPDHEFIYKGGEMPRSEGPRIIDVGIPGPGSRVALWRRSWRDKIIPALVKFNPDIIFISAGFDAHKKDEINFAYIGVQEKDYEWLTDQLVQVANRCCQGRIVSVLEGGYRIQGAVVSAFARSVAAHVGAMAEDNSQAWDPQDAKWEREHEKQLRAEAEARRAAALAAEWAKANAAAQVAAAVPEDGGIAGDGTAAVLASTATLAAAAADNNGVAKVEDTPMEDPGGDEEGGRRKRRRQSVDYVALNKKLEEEQAASKAGGGAPPPAAS